MKCQDMWIRAREEKSKEDVGVFCELWGSLLLHLLSWIPFPDSQEIKHQNSNQHAACRRPALINKATHTHIDIFRHAQRGLSPPKLPSGGRGQTGKIRRVSSSVFTQAFREFPSNSSTLGRNEFLKGHEWTWVGGQCWHTNAQMTGKGWKVFEMQDLNHFTMHQTNKDVWIKLPCRDTYQEQTWWRAGQKFYGHGEKKEVTLPGPLPGPLWETGQRKGGKKEGGVGVHRKRKSNTLVLSHLGDY